MPSLGEVFVLFLCLVACYFIWLFVKTFFSYVRTEYRRLKDYRADDDFGDDGGPVLRQSDGGGSLHASKAIPEAQFQYTAGHHIFAPHARPVPRGQPSPFEAFIQELVRNFNSQRERNYQFAVLYLTAARELDSIEAEFSTANNTPLTNSDYPIWPPEESQVNCLVSRVGSFWYNIRKVHAEEYLCKRAPKFLSDYHSRHGPPGFTVIFSWLMPCSNCTDNIIQTFTSGNRIVAYVCEWKDNNGVPDPNAPRNRDRLRENGFQVEKVRCRLRLCRARGN